MTPSEQAALQALLGDFVVWIENISFAENGPQNPRVLVRHCDRRLLPAHAFPELKSPSGDRVTPFVRGDDGHPCPLYQQGAKVLVSALRDSAQADGAAAGVLSGCQPQPRSKLSTVLENRDIPDAGDERRCAYRSHALQCRRGSGLGIGSAVGADRSITRLQVGIQLRQMQGSASQAQYCLRIEHFRVTRHDAREPLSQGVRN